MKDKSNHGGCCEPLLAEGPHAKIGAYVKTERSSALPFLTSKVLTDFIAESLTLSGLEWMKKVRDWAQQQKAAE